MNYSTIAFLANEEVRAISCVFGEDSGPYYGNGSPKHYTYKTLDKSIKVGDLVVVQCTGPSNYFGYCVVKVVDVDVEIDFSSDLNYKWIVSKVDEDELEDTIKAEKELVKTVRKKEFSNKRRQLSEALGLAFEGLPSLLHLKNDGFINQEEVTD